MFLEIVVMVMAFAFLLFALFSIPSLLQIRHTCVKIQSPQKICGVGSIGFSLCDPRKVECWWEHVAAPEEVHDRIRKAIERAHPPSPSP